MNLKKLINDVSSHSKVTLSWTSDIGYVVRNCIEDCLTELGTSDELRGIGVPIVSVFFVEAQPQ